MKVERVVIDLYDTLVNEHDGALRHGAVDLVNELRSQGKILILWSMCQMKTAALHLSLFPKFDEEYFLDKPPIIDSSITAKATELSEKVDQQIKVNNKPDRNLYYLYQALYLMKKGQMKHPPSVGSAILIDDHVELYSPIEKELGFQTINSRVPELDPEDKTDLWARYVLSQLRCIENVEMLKRVGLEPFNPITK